MRKQEPREKTAACPECGKKFDPRGVAIHMRFAHGRVGKYSASRRNSPDDSPGRVVHRRRRKSKIMPNHVSFCPRCGANMRNVAAALDFGG